MSLRRLDAVRVSIVDEFQDARLGATELTDKCAGYSIAIRAVLDAFVAPDASE